VFQTGKQFTHTQNCGASGYISDSNRNGESLLTTADNGKDTKIQLHFLGKTVTSICEGLRAFQGLTPSPSSGCC